jgi:hypothetical protein
MGTYGVYNNLCRAARQGVILLRGLAVKLIVISGAQTGVDQAALRAARACGIATAGWAPLGYMTEDGPAPRLADYGLAECGEPGYPTRTKRNVAMSDMVLWYGDTGSPGFKFTSGEAHRRLKTLVCVHQGCDHGHVADDIVGLMGGHAPPLRVMAAGSRESRRPGIGKEAEAWLVKLFQSLAEQIRDGV